jgi:hypothetical protein
MLVRIEIQQNGGRGSEDRFWCHLSSKWKMTCKNSNMNVIKPPAQDGFI